MRQRSSREKRKATSGGPRATVTYGVLVPVFLPAVPARFRRLAVAVAVVVVLLVGATRVALGVHQTEACGRSGG